MSNSRNIYTLKERYIQYLQKEKGRGEKTLENYSRYIDRYITSAKCKTASDITLGSIHHFISTIEKTGVKSVPLSEKTLNYHRIALRSFLSFLRTHNIEAPDPKDIPLSHVPPPPFEALSEDECEVLIVAGGFDTSSDLRDTALVYTLLFTGMRVSEICALTCEDFLGGHIAVGERSISIPPMVREVLEQYLNTRKDTDTALFVNNGKRTDINGSIALTPRSVQRIVAQYGARAGIERSVTPQLLRHTRAVMALKSGTGIETVQKELGFTHKTSTAPYLHLLKK